MKMTTWDKMKNYLRDLEIGNVIKRQELLKGCEHDGSTTIDNYRNYLCNAGYLKIVGRGKYEKIVQIDETLSTDQLYHESYPHLNN